MPPTEAPDGGGPGSSGLGTTQGAPPVLVADRIRRNFGAVVAVADATLQLLEGETLGLVGDNGAGKSTLLKILAGVIAPDGGRIVLDGREVALKGPRDALRAGIETVYQDLALVDTMSAAQNVFLGPRGAPPLQVPTRVQPGRQPARCENALGRSSTAFTSRSLLFVRT